MGIAVSGKVRRERPGKAAIMRAAVTVMGEDGYEGASMRDMAQRGGVSVAALYYHFPSKHDLLLEFLDEAYDVILRRIERRLAAVGDDPAALLDELVATLIASYVHDEYAQMASRVALRESSRLDPAARHRIDGKRAGVLRRMHEIVLAGVGTGRFDTPEPLETARAIDGLCASVIEPYDAAPRPLPETIAAYQRFARSLVGCTAPR